MSSHRPFIGIRDDSYTLAALERHCLLLDANGHVKVTTAGSAANAAAADDMANPTAQQMLAYPFVYDGATWDRLRGTSVAGAANIAEQLAPGAEDNTNNIIAGIPRPLAVSTYTASTATNKGAVATRAEKASAGNLFSGWFYNTNAATRWLFLCNIATDPVAGTAALYNPIPIPSGVMVMIGEEIWGQTGLPFSTGIGVAFMTTQAGGTLATAGETWWTVRYK
jgi:hypothetical protein